jgi:glycerol-3-phosphate dehydrogenase subunit B
MRVKSELETGLGMPVFEIPTLPPSIPGMRLASILEKAIRGLGGSINTGLEVTSANMYSDGRIARVWTRSAARSQSHSARDFVLATGGILGGGIFTNSDGEIHEKVFGLPLEYPAAHQEWFTPQFLNSAGQPVFRVGVQVDRRFQPVNAAGQVLHPNLFAAGAALGGHDPLPERSFDGVALVSGYVAGNRI